MLTAQGMPVEDRFWSKVDRRGPDECWPWKAGTDLYGYGNFRVGKAPGRGAHRVAYEFVVGPIPEGTTIDHLCRNRACVNPAHMEPVTNRENVLRGEGLSAVNARKTHCHRGHPFDDENTYRPPGRPNERHCRKCKAERDLERRERVA